MDEFLVAGILSNSKILRDSSNYFPLVKTLRSDYIHWQLELLRAEYKIYRKRLDFGDGER